MTDHLVLKGTSTAYLIENNEMSASCGMLLEWFWSWRVV